MRPLPKRLDDLPAWHALLRLHRDALSAFTEDEPLDGPRHRVQRDQACVAEFMVQSLQDQAELRRRDLPQTELKALGKLVLEGEVKGRFVSEERWQLILALRDEVLRHMQHPMGKHAGDCWRSVFEAAKKATGVE